MRDTSGTGPEGKHDEFILMVKKSINLLNGDQRESSHMLAVKGRGIVEKVHERAPHIV